MKRGQAYLIVILVLVVVGLTAVGIYKSSDKTITGNVVDEGAEDAFEITESECDLETPFSCSIWKVDSSKKEITIKIENIGFENYLIKDIAVEGCESLSLAIEIFEGSAKTLPLKCSFSEGDLFESNLKVFYKKLTGGPGEVSEGFLVHQL